uniref:Secreted protein n=2 Tax=Plectus sambesii TaxID=2011161 RepID=A0A914X233_9BILA
MCVVAFWMTRRGVCVYRRPSARCLVRPGVVYDWRRRSEKPAAALVVRSLRAPPVPSSGRCCAYAPSLQAQAPVRRSFPTAYLSSVLLQPLADSVNSIDRSPTSLPTTRAR